MVGRKCGRVVPPGDLGRAFGVCVHHTHQFHLIHGLVLLDVVFTPVPDADHADMYGLLTHGSNISFSRRVLSRKKSVISEQSASAE
jgi:hypothetical protein